MINHLENILSQLQELNIHTKKKLFLDAVWQEETENIGDLFELKEKMKACIQELEITSPHDIEKINKLLIDIHLLLFNYIWHIDQVRELIEIVIGKYRKATSLGS